MEIPRLSNEEQATFEHVLTVQEIKNVLHEPGENRGMQIRRSVVFLGPIRRSDLIFVQIRIRVTLKIFRGI